MRATARTARLITALAALAIAGCTTPPGPEEAAAPPAPAENEPAAAVTPEPKPPPPPPPAPEGADLLGLTPAEVQDLLGPPSLVRREGTVQVMQFTNETCVLDVVLYEPAPGTHFRADHVAARRRDGGAITAGQCLASRLEGGRWPPAFAAHLAGQDAGAP